MAVIETNRLKLHTYLKTLTDNVYYQPPENLKMSYPAILYSRDDIDNAFANNKVYMQQHVYQITVIDEDPDSELVEQVSQMPTARFERHYTADNLNHDVFVVNFL